MEATLRESKREKRANKKGPITDNDHLGKTAKADGHGHHADRHARNIPTSPMEGTPLVLLVPLTTAHSALRTGRLQNQWCTAATRRSLALKSMLHWLEVEKRKEGMGHEVLTHY